MKKYVKLFLYFFFAATLLGSCTDKKKEAVQKVENIDNKLETETKTLEKETQSLEEEAKELDNL